MRTCATCQKQYGDDLQACPEDGTSLLSEDELSATMTARTAAVGGGMAQTAPPVVRSNASARSTPGGGLRDSQPGAPALSDSLVGNTLSDRYEVTRKIGEGGMGVVYEARHLLIGKRVAIKVLLDKYAQKADIVARLQQEARLASSIGHEHIIDITDFGETHDGRTFVVMEYLEGESLSQLLAREGALPPARTVAIARQVASALGAAHGKGVIHRDVKPENVFIVRRSERDFAKVVDFGISKLSRPAEEGEGASPRLTHTGMVLGTPLYMSPEQARGEDDLDHRIDVYALGVMMYETLTGEVPFRGGNYLSVISQVLSTEPRTPSQVRPDLQITPALEAVVLRAMAKNRDQRYASMAEVDADLARLEKGDSVVNALSAALSGAIHKPRRRGPVLLWVAGVAALIGATVAVVIPLTRGAEGTPKVVEVPMPVATAADAAPVVQPPPPQPGIEKVTVTVVSDPEGAAVMDGDIELGKARPETKFRFAKSSDRVNLILRLDGYEDAAVNVQPTEDMTMPVVKLKKAKRTPDSPRPRARPDAGVSRDMGGGDQVPPPR
jgi:serine/threonine-protein kinase